MEYINRSLSPKDLDERDIPTVLTHLSSALAHMHANRITHRDVKPENVLVRQSENGQGLVVKLADFGTSKRQVVGKMETFAGTGIYMAPEFWKRPLRYNDKVDMFSLGLIGVQCFTRWDPSSDAEWTSRSPSTSREHAAWMSKVIFPHVADAPEQFRPLLRALLRRKPEKRWTANKCLKFLWKVTQEDAGIIEGTGVREGEGVEEAAASEQATEVAEGVTVAEGSFGKSRKRPASALGSDSHGQSPGNYNPSVATARTAGMTPAPDADPSLPDTLSWRAPVPASPSPSWAPTPQHYDTEPEGAEDGGVEDEDTTDDNDTELEGDWDEEEDSEAEALE